CLRPFPTRRPSDLFHLGDQFVQPPVEAVGVPLLACDLPGDLFIGVVHGPASPPCASSCRALPRRTPDRRSTVVHYGGQAWVRAPSGDPRPVGREGGTTMRDPRDLYRFESTEVLEAVPRTGLTLVHALPGM